VIGKPCFIHFLERISKESVLPTVHFVLLPYSWPATRTWDIILAFGVFPILFSTALTVLAVYHLESVQTLSLAALQMFFVRCPEARDQRL